MNVYHYLPFMDQEDIQELIEKIKSGEVTEVSLYKLFPFISKSKLDDLVDYMIEENDTSNLRKSLPFISNDSLNKIKQAIEEEKLEDFDDTILLPFMDGDSIKNMFYAKLKQQKKHEETSEKEND